MIDNKKSENTHHALKSLRQVDVEPSTYLIHRLHANLNNQAQLKKSFFKIKFWQAMSVVMSLAFVVSIIFLKKNPSNLNGNVTEYALNQSYMIHIDIRSLSQTEIAYAEINLDGEGIQFSSAQFSDVTEMKKLLISWEDFSNKQYLPVVVKGTKSGQNSVIVNFYDKNNNKVSSQEMKLNFKGQII